MPAKRKPPLVGSNRKLCVIASGGYGFDGKRRGFTRRQYNPAQSKAYRAKMAKEASQLRFLPGTAAGRPPLNSSYSGYADSYDDLTSDLQQLEDSGDDWDDAEDYGALGCLNFAKYRNKRRARDSRRQHLAANWLRIEPWLAAYRMGQDHKVDHCLCSSVQTTEIAVISLLGMSSIRLRGDHKQSPSILGATITNIHIRIQNNVRRLLCLRAAVCPVSKA